MSKITWRSFRVADRVKKLGTDGAPIRAIPGKPRSAWREGRVGGAMSAIDVVDGARSRHRSAIGWFVGDESHQGSRPHANYHDRFGYRQERVPGSRH
jgi:hypothetical protein